MVQKTKNIAFIVPEDFSWKGEENYFKCLISAIDYDKNLNFKLFTSNIVKTKFKSLKLKNVKIINSNIFEKNSFFNIIRKLLNFVFGIYNPLLIIYLKYYKIEWISHTLPLAFFNNICWFPDFQHVYIKGNFTEKEIVRRNILYKKYIQSSQICIVSSKNSKQHLKKFARHENLPNKFNSQILNFVPNINFKSLKSRDYLIKKYHIKKDYIFIPNQFWPHKNHEVIVKAINLITRKNISIQFVFTGSKFNSKKSVYFNKILNEIKNNNLSKYFLYLGEIPYRDVLSLIYNCRIFINPSFFEGWSSTVEEAKALGASIILSDIPVHIEQKNKNTLVFDPYNEKKLANLILKKLSKSKLPKNLNILKKNYFSKKKIFQKKYSKLIY